MPTSKTLIRSLGSIVLVLSLILSGAAIWALAKSADWATFQAEVAEAYGHSVDPQEWLVHWRVASLTMLAAGVAAAFGGLGLVRARRWGALVLALTTASLALSEVLVTFSGYARYEYEVMEPGEVIFLLAAALVFLFFYLRPSSWEASESAG